MFCFWLLLGCWSWVFVFLFALLVNSTLVKFFIFTTHKNFPRFFIIAYTISYLWYQTKRPKSFKIISQKNIRRARDRWKCHANIQTPGQFLLATVGVFNLFSADTIYSSVYVCTVTMMYVCKYQDIVKLLFK